MKDIYNRKVSLGDLVIPFMPVTGSLNMDKLLGLVIADNKIFIYSESSSSYIVKNCNFCCLVDKEKEEELSTSEETQQSDALGNNLENVVSEDNSLEKLVEAAEEDLGNNSETEE